MMMLSNIFDNIFDDRLFGFFPAVTGLTPRNEPVMKSDICEYDDHYDLTMELAGYSKDDIKVDLDDGTLTIQAVHNNTHDEKDEQGRVIRSERYTGNCQRSFYVGSEVKKEDIQTLVCEDNFCKIIGWGTLKDTLIDNTRRLDEFSFILDFEGDSAESDLKKWREI